MNELKTEIMLSEKKKVQIIENAHQIAKQRKKALKLRYCSAVFLLLIIGITGFFANGHYGIMDEYPIKVYAQDLSGASEIDLIPDKTFTLEKIQTPLGEGYSLYISANDGYYCETICNDSDDGLEQIFSDEDYIYWIPDYWKNKDMRIYDAEGNILDPQDLFSVSDQTATITYCVYNERDSLQFQMTVSLREINGVGKGEILNLVSYPELETE